MFMIINSTLVGYFVVYIDLFRCEKRIKFRLTKIPKKQGHLFN